MIVCDDWRQVRGLLNTTLCDRVCDDEAGHRCTQYNLMREFVMTGGRSEVYSIQPYAIEFVMTGGRSEVYSIQPCVIVCDDWQQVTGVLNRTLCY